MKSQLVVQNKKRGTVLPPSRTFQHAAVRPIADHTAQPEPASALSESRFGQDFSQVAVHAESSTARSEFTPPCPVTPTRCPFGGACHTWPVQVQAKLVMNQPGDEYEQEADRVAEQVMCMPDSQARQNSGVSGWAQAPSMNLQRSATHQTAPSPVPPIVHEVLHSPGQPLDTATRAFMEPRFGYDFSRIRIHTSGRAAETAQMVNARAFTINRDIFFGQGEYQPDSNQGRRLIAHELTHVMQQGAARALASQSMRSTSTTPILSHLAPQTARLQRTTADPSMAPSGMLCTIDASPGHTPGVDIMFGQADRSLDATDMTAITSFHATWLAGGGIDSIIIDGFASTEGRQRFNWQLSCDRAEAVKTALTGLGVPAGMITTIAHGESVEFSTLSLPLNRRAVIHTRPGTVPTAIIFPVTFGSTINRVPPGVGTSVIVLVAGVPVGRTIALDIQGSGGANGTATVAPTSIASTSTVTATGGTQTTPGHANNLMVRARIGGRTLATSWGFTVAAHPRDFTVTLNRDLNTATNIGLVANNAWTSDGAGGVADLTEVDRSEQVVVGPQDDPPFGSVGLTTSGFIAGTASPTADTHGFPKGSISTSIFLLRSGTSFRYVQNQLFIFNDRRTGVINQVVPNSGFTITFTISWNAATRRWEHQAVKTGAATTVGAFSATAGSGTATSLVHPV
jgi:outer membrane protein OmpA-like peptidoglycan-associated protein